MNDTDLAFSSIADVARLFRAGKLSPLELTELLLARIERLNPELNAYITVTAELARAQAKKAGQEIGVAARSRKSRRDRGVLHGIPVCLKDNICYFGSSHHGGLQDSQRFCSRERRGSGDAAERSGRGFAGQDESARIRVRGDQ